MCVCVRERHAHPLIPTQRSDMIAVAWWNYLNKEKKLKSVRKIRMFNLS